ncbi:ubiquinone biosynthesis protein UbiE [Neosynechococcus sphagnicola sy1]|uniref:Ubiquinone biosynthesis protein UbiE n=1 Tax=Neosynechococcus sphagnicola sy1 TaxID=1497020 RepID=A0A098TPJ7_9CYAN|nr:methyltransferase [Neosynechococcus sphagnicola]KGF73812.1 ubiquinone biosynthesis protein UbiE [Neosynechococcus sphagnicola sy1]
MTDSNSLAAVTTPPDQIFNDQWHLYQKVLHHNYMGHREVYGVVHDLLLQQFHHPFSLLDLGCGDAEFISQALVETPIATYTGVDLSATALAIAQENLAALPCQSTWVQDDFFDWVQNYEHPFDLILVSFSLHHLSLAQKDLVMGRLSQLLKPAGVLMLIDICRRPEEDRETYLRRYMAAVQQDWSRLTPQEYQMVESHITICDFPETQITLTELGHRHGFQSVTCQYQDPADTTLLLCFER